MPLRRVVLHAPGFVHGQTSGAIAQARTQRSSAVVQVRHAVPMRTQFVRGEQFHFVDVLVFPAMLHLRHGVPQPRFERQCQFACSAAGGGHGVGSGSLAGEGGGQRCTRQTRRVLHVSAGRPLRPVRRHGRGQTHGAGKGIAIMPACILGVFRRAYPLDVRSGCPILLLVPVLRRQRAGRGQIRVGGKLRHVRAAGLQIPAVAVT